MELVLIRQHFGDCETIGELTIAGVEHVCFTLEDKDRRLTQTDSISAIKQIKVPGETAIPYGRYEVIMTYSNRFKQTMPLLLGVPGFEGIRIHSGNTDDHTEGCILCGLEKDIPNNRIIKSKAAIAQVYMLLTETLKVEKVFISVEKAQVTV